MATTRSRPLRPFCRATTTRAGVDFTCHRMLGHPGPHVCRFDGCNDRREPVRWFSAVDTAGLQSVEAS